MKKLASCLLAVTFSLALASCSAGSDGAGDEPKFQEAAENSENSVSTKPVELTEREPQDFFPGGKEGEGIPALVSQDGRVQCTFYEEGRTPSCMVDFADPPIDPQPDNEAWKSNGVFYTIERGFHPVYWPKFHALEAETLNEGEKVSYAGMIIEAPSANEITMKFEDHYFTIKDDGRFYSDTYPAEPGADGKAATGTICGTVDTKSGESGALYVQQDGTNCNDAMKLVEDYTNYDAAPGEGGSRGIIPLDGGTCGTGAPKKWEDIPENRLLGCSLDSGGSVVLLTPETIARLP